MTTTWAACPSGSYRSAAVVFSCDGATGTSHLQLPPKAATEALEVPIGTAGFHVRATSSGDLGLELHDVENSTRVVSGSGAPVNNSARAGVYEGTGFVFSGDNGTAPTRSNLYIVGSTRHRLLLRLLNRGADWATVVLECAFRGIRPCPEGAPFGCTHYDETAASHQVMAWSRWAQSKYVDAREAWYLLSKQDAARSENGIPWHHWPAIWSESLAGPLPGPSAGSWQPAFHFLDADRNGQVSRDEFAAGFHLYPGGPDARETATGALIVTDQAWLYASVTAAAIGIAVLACLVVYCASLLRWSRGSASRARTFDSRMSRAEADPTEKVWAAQQRSPRGSEDTDAEHEAKGNSTTGSTTMLGGWPSVSMSATSGSLPWAGFSSLWPMQRAQDSFQYGPLPMMEELPQYGFLPGAMASQGMSGFYGPGPSPGPFPLREESFHQSFGMAPSHSFSQMGPCMGVPLPPTAATAVEGGSGAYSVAPSLSFSQTGGYSVSVSPQAPTGLASSPEAVRAMGGGSFMERSLSFTSAQAWPQQAALWETVPTGMAPANFVPASHPPGSWMGDPSRGAPY